MQPHVRPEQTKQHRIFQRLKKITARQSAIPIGIKKLKFIELHFQAMKKVLSKKFLRGPFSIIVV